MKTSTVRISAETKAKADPVLRELGLPMSVAIDAFLLSVARSKEIPFTFSLRKPNATTKAAIRDVRMGKTKKHSSLKALRAELSA